MATASSGTPTTFSDIDPDVIRTHFLSRLDGLNLAALSCVSTDLHRLTTGAHDLWSTILADTWPSTVDPAVGAVIDSFPNGPSSFFSQSFPLLLPDDHYSRDRTPPSPTTRPDRVLSAVDISYRGRNIFSRVHETETATRWFRSSPFRIPLLEAKDAAVPTPIIRKNAGDHEDTCRDLYGEMTLSWIVIDPDGKRAMNLSSFRPVAVQWRWWSGEVVATFPSIVDRGGDKEDAMCCIEVTCSAGGGGGNGWGEEAEGVAVGGGGGEGEEEEEEEEEDELHVREVSMRVEDMNGAHLSGEESLVILDRGFRGRRVNRAGDKDEGEVVARRYEDFLEKRRVKKEKGLRRERRLDLLCVSFGASILVACFMMLVLNR